MRSLSETRSAPRPTSVVRPYISLGTVEAIPSQSEERTCDRMHDCARKMISKFNALWSLRRNR